MTVFLDLDGVCSNFEKGLEKIFNKPYNKRSPLIKTHQWYGISLKDQWEKIDAQGYEWWADLETEPWFLDLKSMIKSFTNDIVILTACPRYAEHAAKGKVLWIRKHFGLHQDFIITKSSLKKHCARPDSVLIDDNDTNIQEFNKYQGKGILFPRIWNSLYKKEDEKLEYVESLLKQHYEN